MSAPLWQPSFPSPRGYWQQFSITATCRCKLTHSILVIPPKQASLTFWGQSASGSVPSVRLCTRRRRFWHRDDVQLALPGQLASTCPNGSRRRRTAVPDDLAYVPGGRYVSLALAAFSSTDGRSSGATS